MTNRLMSTAFPLRKANWFFGEHPDTTLQWTSRETSRLVKQLTGISNNIAAASDNAGRIIVGSPQHNSLIQAANFPELSDASPLGPDDYFIRTVTIGDKPALYLAGKNDRAAMYGLFAFFEELGCKFLLSRDILPAMDPDLMVPSLDVIGKTHCPCRGVWLSQLAVTVGVMSLPDYQRMFTQMAKMRMNRVVYYPFENEPFIDYYYSGERKLIGDTTYPESGYVSLGRQDAGSYRVRDMVVGRELFDREYVAPREFQHVHASAEALDTGKEFMRQLIRLAKERGLGSWLSFDSAFVSLNMAKYTRPMPRPVEFYSALVSFTDPVAHAINRNRIENIIASYPELEGIIFQITEGFYEDRYPESQAVIAREWENYSDALALMREHWGKHWVGVDRQNMAMRADIGFVELMKHSLEAAQALKPELKLGVLTVCKAYLLTHLHKILPKDIAFVDIESQSLWTVDGAPLHLFQQIEGRECALVPRAYDDGSFAGLQYNLRLYQRDGFLASRQNNGTSGLVIQTTHITGNDHNFRFLAEGMWRENLTPETFYSEYATALFGAKAAPYVVEAFDILEENEKFLGGRGGHNMPYTFTPPEVSSLMRLKKHSKLFLEPALDDATIQYLDKRAEKFRQAEANLLRALESFSRASDMCATSGKDELEYLRRKTRAYAQHLETLILFRDAYAEYVAAFRVLRQGVPVFRAAFRQVVALSGRVEQSAIAAAEGFAACVVHPTDLGVTWMMNKPIIGARVLNKYFENILAYFEGREYWAPVEWERLSGSSPYPTYTIAEIDTLVLG